MILSVSQVDLGTSGQPVASSGLRLSSGRLNDRCVDRGVRVFHVICERDGSVFSREVQKGAPGLFCKSLTETKMLRRAMRGSSSADDSSSSTEGEMPGPVSVDPVDIGIEEDLWSE
jgi:hypothetical protein